MFDIVEGGAAYSQLSNFSAEVPKTQPNEDDALIQNNFGSEGRFFAWVMRGSYWLRGKTMQFCSHYLDFYPIVRK